MHASHPAAQGTAARHEPHLPVLLASLPAASVGAAGWVAVGPSPIELVGLECTGVEGPIRHQHHALAAALGSRPQPGMGAPASHGIQPHALPHINGV